MILGQIKGKDEDCRKAFQASIELIREKCGPCLESELSNKLEQIQREHGDIELSKAISLLKKG